VITADGRLDKIADDFVEHCSTHWKSGKRLLVCIDKITCARMHQRILPRWQAKLGQVEAAALLKDVELANAQDDAQRDKLIREGGRLRQQAAWMEQTSIGLISSEGQNEVRDFHEWGFDIRPHRELMKRGFDCRDGRRMDEAGC
jgi:type I restriction enzyme, R subunit